MDQPLPQGPEGVRKFEPESARGLQDCPVLGFIFRLVQEIQFLLDLGPDLFQVFATIRIQLDRAQIAEYVVDQFDLLFFCIYLGIAPHCHY